VRTLRLYTTAGCHLCEQAEQLLPPVLAYFSNTQHKACGLEVEWERVEISDSHELFERYGMHIPVIGVADSDDELAWPFDQAQVFQFLVGCLSCSE
jgi:hypothetical protein